MAVPPTYPVEFPPADEQGPSAHQPLIPHRHPLSKALAQDICSVRGPLLFSGSRGLDVASLYPSSLSHQPQPGS